MEKFKVGNLASCLLEERPGDWNIVGDMDYLLTGKHLVIGVEKWETRTLIRFDSMGLNRGNPWCCDAINFKKVK